MVATDLEKVDVKRYNNLSVMTNSEKISYALGISMAQQMIRSGIYEADYKILAEAIEDMLKNKEPKLPMQEAAVILNDFINQKEVEMAKMNKDVADRFLEGNKSMPGIQTTASGLQYKVDFESENENAKRPKATDEVEVKYRGKFLSGEIFNDTEAKGHTVTFPLAQVIQGWTEGLQLMKEGDKFTFYVPYNLAYGAAGNDVIPPFSALIFEIELVKVLEK